MREAFKAKGWDAVSCDLLPTEIPGQHIQGDVLEVLKWGCLWDLMIAFPPCTHLAVSGARYFAEKRKDGRQQQGVKFFMRFANANIPRIAIENPVGIMSTVWRKPDQVIQPWQFGHDASKATCLWLNGLPPLLPTKIVSPGRNGRYGNQTASGQNKLAPSPHRAQDRARTYAGIARAMSEQWG